MKKIAIIYILLITSISVFSQSRLFPAASLSSDKSELLSLLRQTRYYIESEKYIEAGQLSEQAKQKFKKLGELNDQSTFFELHNVSHAYSEKKKYLEAIGTESLLVEVFPKVFPNNKVDYALYLGDLGFYQLRANDLRNAINNLNVALSIIGDTTDEQLLSLYILASDIYGSPEISKYDIALKYQKKVVDIFAEKYGNDSPEYLNEISFLAHYHEELEDFEKASDLYLNIAKGQVNRDDSIAWDNMLPLLDRIICTSRKANLTDREKQIKEIAIAISLRKLNYHEARIKSPDFPSERDSIEYELITQSINNLNPKQKIDYLYQLPDTYAKAYSLFFETFRSALKSDNDLTIETGLEVNRIFNALGVINNAYIQNLINIAEAYNNIGNPAKAYEYALQAYDLRDDYLSSDDWLYYGIINDLALYCTSLGNYLDAIKYGRIIVAEEAFKKYTDSPFGYFLSISNLATAYSNIGLKDISLYLLENLVQDAEDLAPDVLEGPFSPFLYNLASAYISNGDFEKAFEICSKLKTIREEFGDKELLANIYQLISALYFKKGDLKESLAYRIKEVELREQICNNDEKELYIAYEGIAKIYRALKAPNKAELFERKALETALNNIVTNFYDLPSAERSFYWNFYSNSFLVDYPNFFKGIKSNDASVLYDKTALFAKGMLLNADAEMSKLILSSGDSLSIVKYNNMLRNKALLTTLMTSQSSVPQSKVDSLRNENVRIERDLIKECKVFGDYTKSMRICWQDVQASIKDDDIAIEFVAFPLIDENGQATNKRLYAALTIRKGYKSPKYFELFEEADLDSLINENPFGYAISELIWGPLKKELKNTSNVYFSPTAKLYNLNIEILPLLNYSDNRSYYRLSSTRELAQNRENNSLADKPMKLYGGLKYDMTVEDLSKVNGEYQLDTSIEQAFLPFRSSRDVVNRARVGYLEGTLKEVLLIDSIAAGHNKYCELITGENGTEETLHLLSGKKYGLLHFATHGFYWTEEEAQDNISNNELNFLQMDDNETMVHVEDKAMTRSGLIFSGANLTLKGEHVPEGTEDGIATALEVSHLDFSDCDLVVLSACQSGLGEVSGEGVFGLQRGFKKSGVNTILMSLWEVDDVATCLLMTEFYKNLLSGKMKQESLYLAQKVLRESDKYSNPEYWAAFILLDALN